MEAHHALIRVLAWINIFLAFVASVLLIGMFWGWAMVTDPEQGRLALIPLALIGVYFLLLLASGFGLKNASPWSRWLTLVLGGIILIEGAVHGVRREWGLVLFCAGYSGLVGWLLLSNACKGYFQNE